jgi:hypothetical protein
MASEFALHQHYEVSSRGYDNNKIIIRNFTSHKPSSFSDHAMLLEYGYRLTTSIGEFRVRLGMGGCWRRNVWFSTMTILIKSWKWKLSTLASAVGVALERKTIHLCVRTAHVKNIDWPAQTDATQEVASSHVITHLVLRNTKSMSLTHTHTHTHKHTNTHAHTPSR